MRALAISGWVLALLGGCTTTDEIIIDRKGVNMTQYEKDLAECRGYSSEVKTTEKAARGAASGAVVGGAIGGAGLGFLWFNTYPAQVFMGDVGALALGAALGVVAVVVRQELVLVIMGGVFVVETLSVMIQVASFKLTGKRVFRMAPLHHHFELKGWPEPKVIVRFWIIAIALALLAMSTLKLR